MARELFRETLPSGNLIVSLVSEIEDGDFSADQTRNRTLKENQSKLSNGEWNWLSQVHGTEIIWLDENKRVSGIEGDALATSSQKVIAITVADCLPLLLIEESGILSLLHLGWRGIKEGLLEKSIRLIKTKSQEPMGAVMGPCINACCYEFGQNDMDILVEKYGPKIVSETLTGALSLDMKECVREILSTYDVEIKYDDPFCTNCDPRHWSFRSDGTDKRQVMIAWKEKTGGGIT
ncbi:MAG: polyphenol oxidase family protein [Acidimicrobiales bacterium]